MGKVCRALFPLQLISSIHKDNGAMGALALLQSGRLNSPKLLSPG